MSKFTIVPISILSQIRSEGGGLLPLFGYFFILQAFLINLINFGWLIIWKLDLVNLICSTRSNLLNLIYFIFSTWLGFNSQYQNYSNEQY